MASHFLYFRESPFFAGVKGMGEESLNNRILMPAMVVCDGNIHIHLGKVNIDIKPLETPLGQLC